MKALFAVSLLLVTGTARAGWLEDAVHFGTGLAAGFVVHELGHIVTARAYGEKMEWAGISWTCRAPCGDYSKIAVAGNLASVVLGESLLHTPYRNAFVDGLQTWSTLNPMRYAIKDAQSQQGYRDYYYVDDRVQIALALHAASIGYRHLSKGNWRVGVGARSISFSRDF